MEEMSPLEMLNAFKRVVDKQSAFENRFGSKAEFVAIKSEKIDDYTDFCLDCGDGMYAYYNMKNEHEKEKSEDDILYDIASIHIGTDNDYEHERDLFVMGYRAALKDYNIALKK